MKKFISALLLFVLTASFIYAQKPQAPVSPDMPVDGITHKITYEGVIEVKDAKADLLYKRALTWFKTHYPNPTEVIRENDSLKFKITGKPRFKIFSPADKTGFKKDMGLVQYTITVACKEGRYRYELSEFNQKQDSYYAVEKWMNTKDQSYSPFMADYLTQLDTHAKEVVKSLQEAMTKDKAVKDRDNW